MKKNIFTKGALASLLFCCISLGNTACVNQIEEDADTEVQEGTIPISFSVKVEKPTTKVTNTAFEKGDKMGLFATTASNSLKGKRYIDNLTLEYTEGTTLVPKRAVFYPEGDVSLNFISYHPYLADGTAAGTSVIPVSVYADQSNAKNRSLSDFLVAQTSGVTGSDKAVPLKYQHKLSKLAITLTPDKDTPIEQLKKDNPRIIVTGIKTAADYDLESGTFSNLGETKDIISSGEWIIKDGKLTGKEFIIIPQTLNGNEQSFVMDWNGDIYSCAIPDMETGSSTQCPIDIATMQNSNKTLNCFAGEISDWSNMETTQTDNKEEYNAIHLSALSFSKSSVYRIYHEGMPVAEVCQEYLKSNQLTSRAVAVYPVGEKEETDLKNGIILQLTDHDVPICGGKISWNADDYGFTFTEGDMTGIDKFYIDDSHQIRLEKPENAINVNIASHTLQDIRNGNITEYPIVKIGKQYWMGKELRATTYRDGTALKKQTNLGKDNAGYYKPDKLDIYFYNGEAIKAGELAPEGWKIPADEDWELLKCYIGDDASVLKAGEWQTMVEGEVVPVNNYAQFGAYPVGMWYNGAHNSPYKMTAFWSWDNANNTLSENTIYFLGESNEFVYSKAHIADQSLPTGYKDYYKALSIRCIKE